MRLLTTVLAAALASCGAQTPPRLSPSLAPDSAVAVIAADWAQFAFPAEAGTSWSWNQPHALMGPESPEYVWMVDWWPPSAKWGLDPDGIWWIARWQPTGAAAGSLTELLERHRPDVMVMCMECGTPASTPHLDPAVTVLAVGRHVVFQVVGRQAVARIFPTRPDTVKLTQYVRHEVVREIWVPVRSSR